MSSVDVAGFKRDSVNGALLVTGASAGAGGPADVQVFTADGTWTKPPGVTQVRVLCIGAGGGGGSGRRGATNVIRSGGAGGGSGAMSERTFAASLLGATEQVLVGAAGTGGLAQTVDDQNGNPGTTSTGTFFGTTVAGTSGTEILRASGGIAGGGGQLAAASVSGGGGQGFGAGGGGGAAPATGLLGAPGTATFPSAGGGGAGGGLTAANVESIGGTGGAAHSVFGPLIVGGAVHTNGNNGTQHTNANMPIPAGGGSGGGSSAAAAGGNGGNGGRYGGGGAGGGASSNGFASGAGGNAAGGICVVTSW